MTNQGDREHLNRLLEIYQRNLRFLDQQAANAGGEDQLPTGKRNELLDTRQKVADLQEQLGIAQPVASPTPGTTSGPSQTPTSTEPAPIYVEIDLQPVPGGARIIWDAPSIIGHEETTFESPFKPAELPLVIRALDVLQYRNYPNTSSPTQKVHFSFSQQERDLLTALGLWQADRVDPDAHQKVGHLLLEGLGASGKAVLKQIRNFGFGQDQPISYVFRFPENAIHLAALPWELLWDSAKNEPVFLRSNIIDSIERYVAIDRPVRPPKDANEKLHILALSPSYNIPDILRATERKGRLKSWDKLKAEGKLTYDELSPLTMLALDDYLLNSDYTPDIIHYYGHGTYRDGKGYLLFDDGSGGKELVSTERLKQVFGGARLVVLCACESAAIDDVGGLLTGIAPAVSVDTMAVVAMQLAVDVTAASRFEEVFYDQLLNRGKTLQEAVTRARKSLFSISTTGSDWYVPTLYIRSRTTQQVRIMKTSN